MSGSITGNVVDATSFQPIGCAQVTIAGVEALASQDGQFRFDGVPAGAIGVVAVADGYVASSQTVNAVDGDSVEVTFLLESTGVGAINGIVRDAVTFSPIPAVVVQLDLGRTVTADGSGHFAIAPVSLGAHVVGASAPGYQPNQLAATVDRGEPFVGTILLSTVATPSTPQASAHSGFPVVLAMAAAGVAAFLLLQDDHRARGQELPQRGVIRNTWRPVKRGGGWVIEDDRHNLVSGPYRSERGAQRAIADLLRGRSA